MHLADYLLASLPLVYEGVREVNLYLGEIFVTFVWLLQTWNWSDHVACLDPWGKKTPTTVTVVVVGLSAVLLRAHFGTPG